MLEEFPFKFSWWIGGAFERYDHACARDSLAWRGCFAWIAAILQDLNPANLAVFSLLQKSSAAIYGWLGVSGTSFYTEKGLQ